MAFDLTAFRSQLDRLGIELAERQDAPASPGIGRATARLVRGGSEQTFRLHYGPAIRLADAKSLGSADPSLVFTAYVAPSKAEAFRRAGVQYLDEAGNAWIHFGDVLIDIRGRPRPPGSQPRVSGNLFSTARAQVLFALLAWPRLRTAPQREVAHAAGVSLGQAHDTIRLLGEAGYDLHGSSHEWSTLLDLWAAAFPTGLAKRLALATYAGDIGPVTKVNVDGPVFVSGESAARDLLRPSTLTLYVEELDPHLAIANRWRADGPPNVIVRRKFWQAPDHDDAQNEDLREAPWPLVYADLLDSDDPRTRAVAKEWRTRFARPEQGF